MGPIISVFIMILVIAVLASLTFLFVASLKSQSIASAEHATYYTYLFPAAINGTGYALDNTSIIGFRDATIISIVNTTDVVPITSGNYTIIDNRIYNTTSKNWVGVLVNYSYSAVSDINAYDSINKTENAGTTIVGYLPLIFLAVIFGAILTLVLKVILPYINFGNQYGQL